MDDLEGDSSSAEFESLFIKEEEKNPERNTVEHKSPPRLTGTQLTQSALIKPYLQEMDELLKSCEELTGISFASQYSETNPESHLGHSLCVEGVHGEIKTSTHDYLSTSYIDTHVEGTEGTKSMAVNNYGAPLAMELPLTTAGNKLSETMVEYEGQLWGMLAMLENMEEAGMDSELREWTTNSGQEYLNIRKDAHRINLLDETTQMERKDKQQDKMSFLGQQVNVDPKNNLACCGETISRRLFEENREDNEVTEDGNEYRGDAVDLRSGRSELEDLGLQMEECVMAVQQLEEKRKKLLKEVLELRGLEDNKEVNKETETEDWVDSKVVELMKVFKKEEEARREERKKEICNLKQERAEEEKKMWKINLERQALQEDVFMSKKRLFGVARECALSQAALNNQRRDVDLLKREKEQLNSFLQQLMEENSKLRTVQQEVLAELRAKLHRHAIKKTSNTQQELTECRRNSWEDVQQYLQCGQKALEDRYEPILLALLKRKEATSGALVKAKDHTKELRAQLTPLKEEIQKLHLQRACLEEKLKLVRVHRCEDLLQYKEVVCCLEESSRKLKTELEIQKRKNKEMEELRDKLAKQLQLQRTAAEGQRMDDHEDKT